jgi:hypothetical protein
MLIFYGGMETSFSSSVIRPLCRAPCLPFYRLRGGRDTGGVFEVKFCRTLWRLL